MTVSITFSHDDIVSGRWTGVGRPMTAQEINLDLYNIKTAVETLQANYTLTVSIASVTQPTSSTMRVTLTDATFTDITMPIAGYRSRGDWATSTPYLVNDTFNAPNGGLYRVIFDHTSDATSFSPTANDGAGHDYYAAMIPARGNTIAAGGAVGMYYRKNSVTDYVANWSYIQSSEVRFAASTGSTLVSTTVAAALEELEGLIGSGVVDAASVTFTPSTGSSLTSTNVAGALEELEAGISAPVGYLALAGGTMTGALTLSADPASALQATTKQYVDGIALNLGKRQTVRAATTTNIVIASALNSGDVLDGVTLATNDLVLVKNQSTPAQNGIYLVDVSPVRSIEFDTYNEHPGALIAVQEGTVNADTIWLCTSNAGGTLGTTPLIFSQSSTSGALLAATATLAVLNDVNVTEGAGIDKFELRWDNGTSKWIAEARPYDVMMFCPGAPGNSALMSRIVIPRVVVFPSGLSGSYASSTVAATAATVLTLARNGTSIGTVNFALGATTGTFTFSGAVTTAAGDVLTLTNQATADATLANISVTLVGTR